VKLVSVAGRPTVACTGCGERNGMNVSRCPKCGSALPHVDPAFLQAALTQARELRDQQSGQRSGL
jgi:tRNA(Ile2) C34 agmatinyltransferase TiaS